MNLVDVVVPRSLADLLGARPAMLRYPTGPEADTYQIALWLTEANGGRWQFSDERQSPLFVARRLRFFRWLFEPEFLAHGGRLTGALKREGRP